MTQFVLVNDASTTLAAAAASGATTLTLASSTNFPSSIPAGFVLPLILNDAATRNIYEIVYVTAISGTTLTVLRGQEGTTAQNWNIGDFSFVAMTAAVFTSVLPVRSVLTGATNLYVNASTGSDANNGLTSGTAWATLQHAWNVLQSSYDMNGQTVTINIAAGTYSAGVVANGLVLGQGGAGSIIWNGAGSSTIISSGSGAGFEATACATFTVQNCELTNTTGISVYATTCGSIALGAGITFGSGNSHLQATQEGNITCSSNYTISGGATNSHLSASIAGTITYVSSGITVTVTGTPAFGNFAVASTNALINVAGSSYSGAATGTRYAAQTGGGINTNGGGANFFPGSVAGTATAPGWYA